MHWTSPDTKESGIKDADYQSQPRTLEPLMPVERSMAKLDVLEFAQKVIEVVPSAKQALFMVVGSCEGIRHRAAQAMKGEDGKITVDTVETK